MAALVAVFFLDSDAAMVVASGALLLLPASDLLLRVQAAYHRREDSRIPGAAVISPCPAPDARTTRRFLRTTAIRVMRDEVVLTDAAGRVRGLALSGTHGVGQLARLHDPRTGRVLGIELRDRGGRARALLPHRYWFAGSEGPYRWNQLVEALNAEVVDESLRSGADSWWQGHLLSADVRAMAPMEAGDVRAASGGNRSAVAGGELALVPLFAALLLPGVLASGAEAFTAGLLSALTIVAVWGPLVGDVLVSRLHADKFKVGDGGFRRPGLDASNSRETS
ncbi:hypothetical protein ACGFZL_06330 [Streptomyces sp. NPDC048182]|uniref:hypothetical protein n=1 Tax=Streptomyces sp. NPDC048182 TaxID=3365507 RepID=UPI003717CD67